MDERPAAQPWTPAFPQLTTHTLQSEGLPPTTITLPQLWELVTDQEAVRKRPYLRVILSRAIRDGGTVTVRSIQQMTHHNSGLKTPGGNPFDAETIRKIMTFLAGYEAHITFDGQTLQIIDQSILEWDL